MPRVLNMHADSPHTLEGAVYVGRGSKWGNPFRIGARLGRETTIKRYAEWILTKPELLLALQELRGKNLACWCAPRACHADVLLKLANADTLKA